MTVSAPPATLPVDSDRLWSSLMVLARIGEYPDAATGLMGVNRQALTDEDAAGRRLLIGWMEDAGLTVTIDAMGNVFGRREGTDPDALPVVAGSHIDSVGTAGAFDGCLGVLGALEVVRAMNDAGVTTRRPVIVASWTEEEGVRFGTDMLGSAVATGRIPLEQAYDLRDGAGLRFGDELARIGFRGDASAHIEAPHAYVECHIEQGPILAAEGHPVGVVTGVQAISWQRITVHGRAAHAGTTPTELRVDAGLAAARIVVHVRQMVDSGEYGQLRATVGHFRTEPSLPNVVPELAEITVDLRNPDDGLMARAEADLAAFLAQLQTETPGLRIETEQTAKTPVVPFDEDVQNRIEKSAYELGFTTMRLMSGAGHDAQEMAAIAPSAMVFVRGQYDGISHNPREYSTPEDCAAGVRVLAETILGLAE